MRQIKSLAAIAIVAALWSGLWPYTRGKSAMAMKNNGLLGLARSPAPFITMPIRANEFRMVLLQFLLH